jgi:large subunit ribosomal protein L20
MNAALRNLGTKYSIFIKKLKDNKIELDRKILSQLAVEHSEIFKKIVEKAK